MTDSKWAAEIEAGIETIITSTDPVSMASEARKVAEGIVRALVELAGPRWLAKNPGKSPVQILSYLQDDAGCKEFLESNFGADYCSKLGKFCESLNPFHHPPPPTAAEAVECLRPLPYIVRVVESRLLPTTRPSRDRRLEDHLRLIDVPPVGGVPPGTNVANEEEEDTTGAEKQYRVRIRPSSALDDDNRSTLDTWLERGLIAQMRPHGEVLWLSPLLGQGLRQIGNDNETIRWDEQFVVEVAATVKRYGQQSSDKGQRLERFLEGVTARRGRRRIESAPSYRETYIVRRALLELAFEATEAFIAAWSDEMRPVVDWSSHGVQLLDSGPLEAKLAQAIQLLIEHECPELLGAHKLAARLRRLQRELFRGERTCTLDGPVVEWLTDVFWHAMTCDSPIYPRHSELVLQVSLIVQDAPARPLRRVEPSLMTERLDPKFFQAAVANSLERGIHIHSPKRARLYSALADVLSADHQRWRRHKEAASLNDCEVALALSTSFDLDLEVALAAKGEFHVALPVFVEKGRGDASRGELGWVVGLFGPVDVGLDFETRTERVRTPQDGWHKLNSIDVPSKLHGPLVMKLNGSPLHQVDEGLSAHPGLIRVAPEQGAYKGKSVRRRSSGPRPETEMARIWHAVLLDEFDVFQLNDIDQDAFKSSEKAQIQAQNSGLLFPRWLAKTFQSRMRYWLLLGCRLDDLSVRLQLFTQLGRLWMDGRASAAIVSDTNGDGQRARLLDWLGIRSVAGDLEETRFVDELESLVAAIRLES